MNYSKLLNNYKIQLLLVVVFLSIFSLFLSDANPSTFDARLGIEFVGGVRIPITLEKNVDATTMDSIVETLKNRINSYGMSQAIVRPIGGNEVLVEIPQADEKVISSVKKILQDQGRFEGIIDGKIAVSGESVVAVGGANGEQTPENLGAPQWSLSFTVTRGGADLFAKAALNKANYPVYMFLDRPENAAVILARSDLTAIGEKQASDALVKENDNMLLLYSDELSNSTALLANKSRIILTQETLTAISDKLTALGFSNAENATKRILVKTKTEMQPTAVSGEISEWKAIGLLSSPRLSEGLAGGTASQFYSISGTAVGATQQEQEEYSQREIKQLKSVISGGKLPVSALVGSSFSIEPSLGKQFLNYSWIATLLAILVVAFFIIIRYGDLKLSIPIVLINSCEILILTAIIGKIGTLDLATMAAVISLIGTGVADQLIITDELLRKKTNGEEEERTEYNLREKIGKAFTIIFTIAGVAIVAMLPLLLSGMVEISGFALSVIIGILAGVFITRPAFGVILEEMYTKK